MIQGALATVPDWVTPEQLHTVEVDLLGQWRTVRAALPSVLEHEGAAQARLARTQDHRNAVEAFLAAESVEVDEG